MDCEHKILELVQVHGLSTVLNALGAVCDKYASENRQPDVQDFVSAKAYVHLESELTALAGIADNASL